jgi:hypothetical protein
MRALLSNNRTLRYLALSVIAVALAVSRGSSSVDAAKAPVVAGDATSVTFTVGAYDCWGSGAPYEFFIGNTKVGEVNVPGDCDCYAPNKVFTTSDPAAMALVNAPMCTSYRVVRNGGTQFGFVEVDVTRTTGTEHVTIFDETPASDNQNICNGHHQWSWDLSGGATGSPATCAGPAVDTDGDGLLNGVDNCPDLANADQADTNSDGHGNACEVKSVTFEINQSHNGSDTFHFFIGGTEVASRPSSSQGWVNFANVTQAVPQEFLHLAEGDASCIEFKVTRDQYWTYFAYGRVKVDTWSTGSKTICIADFLGYSGADGGDCDDRWGHEGYSYDSYYGVDGDNGNTDANVFLSAPEDTDGDGTNDCSDADIDGDGIGNGADNCPVTANASQTDTNNDGVGDACEAAVVAVPWQGLESKAHVVYSGGSVVLQAVASVAGNGEPVALTSGTWDPGDGSGPQAINVSNSRALELTHTYSGADFTPFTATVSVTTPGGRVLTDTMKVQIVPKSLDAEVNMAIDKALWYEHKRMKLDGEAGKWTDDNTMASTASTTQAFQVNGSRESGDPKKNPYVSDVARGLRYLQNHIRRISIGVQPAGDPDVNGNGYGLETDEGHVTYVGGQIVDAFVASGTPNKLAVTGPEVGRSYKAIVQDLLDAYSWGQYEDGHGGWVYDWNQNGGIDSSSSGWWGVASHAADVWGAVVPAWVKSKNLTEGIYGTLQGYDGSGTGRDGSCGYRATNDWNSYAQTAACLIMMSTDGVARSDARYQASEQYLKREWGGAKGNIYDMYNLTKAMRTAPGTPITMLGGTIDWYGGDGNPGNAYDTSNGYARFLVSTQNSDGSTGTTGWVGGGTTSTAWMILILSPALFEQGPTAVCSVDATTVCQAGAVGGCNVSGTNPYATVNFDGSQSTAGDNPISSYSWNFQNGAPTVDATTVSASTSYSATGTYNVQLTVTDSKGNASSVTCPVSVTSSALPPVADAGGPYQMCVGSNTLTLDASGSLGRGSNIVSYEWDFTGAITFTPVDATGVTTNQAAFFAGLGIGTHDVGLRITDDLGNVVIDYSTVTVRDCDPPVITVPANINLVTPNPSAPVSFTVSATDNVDTSVPVTCVSSPTAGLSSGSDFPVGTTTMTCDASDSAGNAAVTKTFTITVSNNTPPTITVPATITVAATSPAGATVNYTATGDDAQDGALPAVCDIPSGSTFALGNTTVTCTVTDSGGLTATDTFVVTVFNNPPSITVPANISVIATSPAGASVNFVTTGSDPQDGSLVPSCSHASGATFALGTTTVSCTVTDSGGLTASASFTVTVTNVAPVCQANRPMQIIWPPNHQLVSIDPLVAVTDADGQPITIVVTSIRQDELTNDTGDGNTSIDGFGVGTGIARVRAERIGDPKKPGNGRVYYISYTATDVAGASCTGVITAGVPHDQGGKATPIGDGPLHDSTVASAPPPPAIKKLP